MKLTQYLQLFIIEQDEQQVFVVFDEVLIGHSGDDVHEKSIFLVVSIHVTVAAL